MRRRVESQLARGATFVKLMASGGGLTPGTDPAQADLPAEMMRAAVEVAHSHGAQVAAHCHATESIVRAIEARVDMIDLLAASLRMRPDRIILGELRGPEAYAFLRAINTGHPGSMTSVHADSAERAIEQIVLLVLQAGTQLGRDDVRHYVRNTVDVFVQLTRTGGRRRVAEVVLSH